MPQDAFSIRYLVSELADELVGAKISKINQPFPDEIQLLLYGKTGTKRLTLSANPNLCRIHFTQETFQNPAQALSFQMTLRKHLTGGTVEEISQDPSERVVRFRICTKNELADSETHFLVFEMTGRTANLLLLRADKTVIAALHTSGLEAERRILPNFPYAPLTQDKLRPDDPQALARAFENFEGDLKTFLSKRVKGFSKQTVTELCARLEGLPPERIAQGICEFMQTPPAPCILFSQGLPVDWFPFPYPSAGTDFRPYPTLSAAIDAFTAEKNLRQRFRDKARPLASALKGQITKQEKKLQRIGEKLLECEDAERFRIFGELLTANLYRVRQGDARAVCQNYYEPDCPDVCIPLDVRLDPAQNAQKYYKKYNKLKVAKEYALAQRAESEQMLDYLRTVEYSFSVCTRFEEIEQLAAELRDAGILKKSGGKKKAKEEKITPFLYECEGFRIAVGKNNLQNDVLSFKTAQAGDVWLHVKDFHGCHTLILNHTERPVPESVIEVAAEIAAYYSQADRESKVVVDYVDKKFLKKPPASPAGFVIYTNFKSCVVKPDPHDDLRKE